MQSFIQRCALAAGLLTVLAFTDSALAQATPYLEPRIYSGPAEHVVTPIPVGYPVVYDDLGRPHAVHWRHRHHHHRRRYYVVRRYYR